MHCLNLKFEDGGGFACCCFFVIGLDRSSTICLQLAVGLNHSLKIVHALQQWLQIESCLWE